MIAGAIGCLLCETTPPSHPAAVVGHLLKGMCADTLEEAHPRHLTALIEKIDEAVRLAMRSSER